MKKDRGQAPKAKPKERSTGSRTVTVRVPVAAHETLKKVAERHHLSVNALLNYYIQQIAGQEAEPETHAAEALPASVPAEEAAPRVQGNFADGAGIRHERVDITSDLFSKIYFRSYIPSLICNVVFLLLILPIKIGLIWLLNQAPGLYRYIYSLRFLRSMYIWNLADFLALTPLILVVLWSTGRIILGNIRKDGVRIISGWAWLAGVLSAIAAILAVLRVLYIDWSEPEAADLLRVLALAVLVGLLVNAPVEISLALNKRRTKNIHAHLDEWGKEVCDLLLQRETQPEMTKEMVLLSWGKPTVIKNREAIKGTTTEEWVYRSAPKTMYVWFVNGAVSKVNDFGK